VLEMVQYWYLFHYVVIGQNKP